MKREINGSHSVAFTCINDLGEIFERIDCPTEVTNEIDEAIGRRQMSGVVYARGMRWSWTAEPLHPLDDDVVLDFERGGQVVERYTIPWQSWEAFKVVAARNGQSAKDYLTLILGCGLAEGETVGEMIHWLFSLPSEPS